MMPSNPTLPEDVRERAAEDLMAVSGSRESAKFLRDEGMNPWKNALAEVDAIAPLIIEWARKDQAEKDAQLSAHAFLLHELPTPGTGPFTIQQQAADEARTQIAAAIRAQFPETPDETTGGE